MYKPVDPLKIWEVPELHIKLMNAQEEIERLSSLLEMRDSAPDAEAEYFIFNKGLKSPYPYVSCNGNELGNVVEVEQIINEQQTSALLKITVAPSKLTTQMQVDRFDQIGV